MGLPPLQGPPTPPKRKQTDGMNFEPKYGRKRRREDLSSGNIERADTGLVQLKAIFGWRSRNHPPIAGPSLMVNLS